MQGSQAGLGDHVWDVQVDGSPSTWAEGGGSQRYRAGAGGSGAFRGFWEVWAEKAEPWSHSEALGGCIWGWGRRRGHGTQV